MPGVKRESTSTSSPDPDLEPIIKKTPPSTPNSKKAKTTPKEETPNKPKHTKQSWTEDEEIVFTELIGEVLKENLYAKIKLDGRLQRESPAVTAHLKAFMNKVKRV
ncbi:uncharacterized protein L201_004200 [Kwoniella dendrophila CBS 6074]|uniref:Myb-like domain-containing protein n=1 Tax=Kwoniella dendrophila CBS 6074 TaxID=1295534 RepID=A0AAX4JVF0_9TREE